MKHTKIKRSIEKNENARGEKLRPQPHRLRRAINRLGILQTAITSPRQKTTNSNHKSEQKCKTQKQYLRVAVGQLAALYGPHVRGETLRIQIREHQNFFTFGENFLAAAQWLVQRDELDLEPAKFVIITYKNLNILKKFDWLRQDFGRRMGL